MTKNCKMAKFAYSQALFVTILFITVASCQEWPNIEQGPKSLIALEGTNVSLSCILAALNDTSLLVTWQRNGQSIGLGRHRQALVHSVDGSVSTLEIEHVTELDEGFYQCTARTDLGLDVSKPAKLVVQYEAKISSGKRSIFNVTSGSKVPIECEARGSPPPKIELLINNSSILEDDEPRLSNVLHHYVAYKSVNVTCRASNFVTPLNRTVSDEKIFEVFVFQIDQSSLEVAESIENEEESRRRPSGYCAPYLGTICKRHLARNSLIFYNMTNEEEEDEKAAMAATSGGLNERLVSSLWVELIESLQEPCRSAAETLLCVYAFPQCTWARGEPEAKPLCQEECIAVRESFCVREWALLEDNRQRGIYFRSRGHFRLPECESLPSHQNSSEPEDCTRSDLLEIRQKDITFDCIKGRGRFYQGLVNITKTGHTCQRWDQQQPHAHNRPPMIFPEIWNSENYCRNAGGEERMPWCYTTDSLIRWQHCEIPHCPETETIEGNVTESLDTLKSEHSNILIQLSHIGNETYNIYKRFLAKYLGETNARRFALPFILAFSGFIALIILLFITVAIYQVYQKRILYRQTMINAFGGVSNDELDLSKLHSNATYHVTQPHLNPVLEALEYPRNSLIYIRDIGQGAFGRVFVAKAPGLGSGMVAVKVLREEASEEMITNFTREATLMSEFEHTNVVKLLGVCAVGKPMCLLVEYMSRGDLNSFLRTLGPSNYVVHHPNQLDAFVDNPIKLSRANLLDFGRQIASGMTYLSARNFVHRDLATRNCLVGEGLEIKISDFGLSQRLAANIGFYSSENGSIAREDEAVPIRWMALESITFGRYTPASDVWAFGVVLWEIFTYALQPYYGMTHEQVIAYLNNGHVLTCPDNCSEQVYALMKSCWAPQPEQRPTFDALERSLRDLLLCDSIDLDADSRSQRTANESIISLLD